MVQKLEEEVLDSEAIAAMHLISQRRNSGISYLTIQQQGLLAGAITLLNLRLARRDRTDVDTSYYHLTDRGQLLLTRIIDYANQDYRESTR